MPSKRPVAKINSAALEGIRNYIRDAAAVFDTWRGLIHVLVGRGAEGKLYKNAVDHGNKELAAFLRAVGTTKDREYLELSDILILLHTVLFIDPAEVADTQVHAICEVLSTGSESISVHRMVFAEFLGLKEFIWQHSRDELYYILDGPESSCPVEKAHPTVVKALRIALAPWPMPRPTNDVHTRTGSVQRRCHLKSTARRAKSGPVGVEKSTEPVSATDSGRTKKVLPGTPDSTISGNVAEKAGSLDITRTEKDGTADDSSDAPRPILRCPARGRTPRRASEPKQTVLPSMSMCTADMMLELVEQGARMGCVGGDVLQM